MIHAPANRAVLSMNEWHRSVGVGFGTWVGWYVTMPRWLERTG
jgi:hypothetical protein